MSVTWNVEHCSLCAFLTFLGNMKSNGKITVKGNITDTSGNTHNLSNVDVDFSSNVIIGEGGLGCGYVCNGGKITWRGEIEPDSDICILAILFQANYEDNLVADVCVNNKSGKSGNNILLKAGNKYIIEIVEEMTCSDTCNIPAPSGTC